MSLEISILHNKYKIRGGEDSVVENEKAILIQGKNTVAVTFVSNDVIRSFLSKLLAFMQTPFVWSHHKLINCQIISRKKTPDIVHVHNYFPLLSPSIFAALKRRKLPTVHTLHNYRSVCPTALLMHNGKVQERSVTGSSWWAIKEKVYRNSYIGTFALCCMIELHKKLGTWHKHVDAYIALTEFSKSKFIEAGWPAEKIHVKPNFVHDKFNGAATLSKEGGYAIYVGRLSEEKGIACLLEAWRTVDYPLKIVGEGPLSSLVTEQPNPQVDYLGRRNHEQVLELVQGADLIVLPSLCYEGFPMVLVEAMSCGTPAIVSGIGSMEEIVIDGKTGKHFDVNSSSDLVKKINSLLNAPEVLAQMSANARTEYLKKYTPEKNYRQLLAIYKSVLEQDNINI